MRFGHVVYRNVRQGRQLSRAEIRPISFKFQQSGNPDSRRDDVSIPDAVHVYVRLPRPWKPQAGQYIYLCVPGVSRRSTTQLHPFYVAWWHHNSDHDYAVLIVQKHGGFTNRIFSKQGQEMRAVIEGPFGKELGLDSYGTVLLFATDIGIAGQLPYVARLLKSYHNCEVKTRRIALYWQVDAESKCSMSVYRLKLLIILAGQTAWAADMLSELLRLDIDRVRLYPTSSFRQALIEL